MKDNRIPGSCSGLKALAGSSQAELSVTLTNKYCSDQKGIRNHRYHPNSGSKQVLRAQSCVGRNY